MLASILSHDNTCAAGFGDPVTGRPMMAMHKLRHWSNIQLDTEPKLPYCILSPAGSLVGRRWRGAGGPRACDQGHSALRERAPGEGRSRRVEKLAGSQSAESPYKCDYCPEVFPTIESLNGHMRCCGPGLRGVYDGEYEVESILDVRGTADRRFFKVWWAPQADGALMAEKQPLMGASEASRGLHGKGECILVATSQP